MFFWALLNTSPRGRTSGWTAHRHNKPGHRSLLATSSPPSATTKTSGHRTARRSPSSSGALVQRGLEKVFHLPHLFPEPAPSFPLSWLTTFIDKNLTFYAIWEHLALASAACLPSPGSAKHAVTYQPLLTKRSPIFSQDGIKGHHYHFVVPLCNFSVSFSQIWMFNTQLKIQFSCICLTVSMLRENFLNGSRSLKYLKNKNKVLEISCLDTGISKKYLWVKILWKM